MGLLCLPLPQRRAARAQQKAPSTLIDAQNGDIDSYFRLGKEDMLALSA
jgi:hypothetical protein